MRLIVNGSPLEVDAADLAGALAALDYGEAVVGTAVNGVFVPVALRPMKTLADGDRIEIVSPRQGG